MTKRPGKVIPFVPNPQRPIVSVAEALRDVKALGARPITVVFDGGDKFDKFEVWEYEGYAAPIEYIAALMARERRA